MKTLRELIDEILAGKLELKETHLVNFLTSKEEIDEFFKVFSSINVDTITLTVELDTFRKFRTLVKFVCREQTINLVLFLGKASQIEKKLNLNAATQSSQANNLMRDTIYDEVNSIFLKIPNILLVSKELVLDESLTLKITRHFKEDVAKFKIYIKDEDKFLQNHISDEGFVFKHIFKSGMELKFLITKEDDNNVSITEVEVKKSGYLFEINGAWLNCTNMNVKGSSLQDFGWKFHVTVNYNDLGKATDILLGYNLKHFKVVSEESKKYLAIDKTQAQKSATLYIYMDPMKNVLEWAAVIRDLAGDFQKAKIRAGAPVATDLCIPETFGYVYCRNDLACGLFAYSPIEERTLFICLVDQTTLSENSESIFQKIDKELEGSKEKYLLKLVPGYATAFQQESSGRVFRGLVDVRFVSLDNLTVTAQPCLGPMYSPGGYFPLQMHPQDKQQQQCCTPSLSQKWINILFPQTALAAKLLVKRSDNFLDFLRAKGVLPAKIQASSYGVIQNKMGDCQLFDFAALLAKEQKSHTELQEIKKISNDNKVFEASATEKASSSAVVAKLSPEESVSPSNAKGFKNG